MDMNGSCILLVHLNPVLMHQNRMVSCILDMVAGCFRNGGKHVDWAST